MNPPVSPQPYPHFLPWLAVVGALLVVLLGGWRWLPHHLPSTVYERVLSAATTPLAHEREGCYTFDLSSLQLARHSDQNSANRPKPAERATFSGYGASTLVLFEDDRPLTGHLYLDKIRRHPGFFSHWGDFLYFSTSDGSSPLANGKSYKIRYSLPDPIWGLDAAALETLARWTLVAILLVLGRLAWLMWRRPASPAHGRITLLLLLALAASFWLQNLPLADRFMLTKDSPSYFSEEYNVRLPLYRKLASLVGSAEEQRAVANPADSGLDRAIGILQTGTPDHFLARLANWQRVAVFAGLLGLFVGLARHCPPPLAAVFVLLLGLQGKNQPFPTLPVAFPLSKTLLGLALVLLPLGWFLARRRGWRFPWWLPLLLAGIALSGHFVWEMLVHRETIPSYIDYILSEPITMAANSFLVMWLLLFFHSWRPVHLFGFVLTALFSFWMRPAQIFTFGLFGLIGLLLLWRDRKRFLKPLLLSGLLLGGLFLSGPLLFPSKNSDTFQHFLWMVWAAPITHFATPADLDAMPDAPTRQLLGHFLAEREQLVPQPPGQPRPYEPSILFWHILFPKMQQMVGAGGYTEAHANLLKETLLPILRAHWQSFLSMQTKVFLDVIGRDTRIQPYFGVFGIVWLLGFWALLTRLARPNLDRVLAAGLLIAAHIGHMMVVALYGSTTARYVYATEYLVVVGALLMIVEGVHIAHQTVTELGAVSTPVG